MHNELTDIFRQLLDTLIIANNVFDFRKFLDSNRWLRAFLKFIELDQ